MNLLSFETCFIMVSFIAITIVLFKSITIENPNKHQHLEGTVTIPLKVRECPKLSWEASKENEVLDGGSISIPSSDVEEVNLWIINKDGAISAKLESVRMRSQNHEKIVLLENVNQEDVYTVPVPLGTKDLTFIIKETDNKISVELESVS